MADKQPSSADNPTKPLHPVYTVTNIQNKVRVLDGDKVTYSDWVKLFKLHALAYDVLSHIDGSAPPSSTDPTYESWSKIDAIVLQWILGTLSDTYVKRVIDNVGTAQQAWDRLHTVFLNNKNARAATLEHAFTTTTMASCSSLNDYFQRMKDLADQLNDVDHPVSESRLVLQMVTGLPQEYDTVASFITQAEKSWDDARDMIEREQRRQAARQSIHTALSITNAAPNQNTPPTPSPNPTPPPPYHPAQTYDTRNHTQSQNRGRGRGRSSYRGRGRGRYQFYSQTQPTYQHFQTQNPPPNYPPSPAPYPWWAAPPPCPHPAQAPWAPTWTRPAHNTHTQPTANPPPNHSGYGLTHPTIPYTFPAPPEYQTNPPVDPLQPTELGTALSALTINSPVPMWNMDTGASSHLTADPGSQDWTTSFTP
ncbi:hypothetical protein HanXRQr2_Chr10g0420611 [Helianthus annuus]|uniref:Uncharacterized protein n=1 Tax=Helianthus annuus TaxID=4232 RepID=A0A9K3HUK2_HELAN|nr:vacuolar protein-sorting protein BRO1 [Helianthus annuus]KAF5784753.1 hypothetical protein HanXRQr2_Chr10g0420611 [Helianthus annuus]KAJ0528530.1 hypothetical protein HanHA89_Chr10g0367451 [Helianthus annuus]KAJ0695452.1 hypothetical protein HanLR1_Chr10g0345791 [Helianthus annuus]KAJ0882159.1 hypothetical protein HanPSC8_Chr10g0406451 [Helianthus annuus]